MDLLFDLFTSNNFFDAKYCAELINELEQSRTGAATVYGRDDYGSVDVNVRKTERLRPSQGTAERVTEKLVAYRDEVGRHFRITLTTCEEPQFLRYRVGDFFVAHQDGNTGLIESVREQSRKISVVIFLNGQTEFPEAKGYCGGSLVFTAWRPHRKRGTYAMPGEAGKFVAFPSETTHEVTPVTHGVRYSIASWYG